MSRDKTAEEMGLVVEGADPVRAPAFALVRSQRIEGLSTWLTPKFDDHRGFFERPFDNDQGIQIVGVNHSFSRKHVFRGLHGQVKNPQGKLVTVCRGLIRDVVLDVRPDSPTFLSWMDFYMAPGRALFVPPGCLHGFQALEDVDVLYGVTAPYQPENDGGASILDPELSALLAGTDPAHLILSDKDRAQLGTLAEFLAKIGYSTP